MFISLHNGSSFFFFILKKMLLVGTNGPQNMDLFWGGSLCHCVLTSHWQNVVIHRSAAACMLFLCLSCHSLYTLSSVVHELGISFWDARTTTSGISAHSYDQSKKPFRICLYLSSTWFCVWRLFALLSGCTWRSRRWVHVPLLLQMLAVLCPVLSVQPVN